MFDILVAQFFRSFIGLRVVIAIGHSQTALDGVRNVVSAVLVILSRSEFKKGVDSDSVEMGDLFQHIIAIFYCIDALKFILQRRGPVGFDRLLVHSAAVIITDLLNFRSQFGINLD